MKSGAVLQSLVLASGACKARWLLMLTRSAAVVSSQSQTPLAVLEWLDVGVICYWTVQYVTTNIGKAYYFGLYSDRPTTAVDPVIIVRNRTEAAKPAVTDAGINGRTFTVAEVKGLEFNDVLIWNFFGTRDDADAASIIHNQVQNQNAQQQPVKQFSLRACTIAAVVLMLGNLGSCLYFIFQQKRVPEGSWPYVNLYSAIFRNNQLIGRRGLAVLTIFDCFF